MEVQVVPKKQSMAATRSWMTLKFHGVFFFFFSLHSSINHNKTVAPPLSSNNETC
jgi:hypothetical protein